MEGRDGNHRWGRGDSHSVQSPRPSVYHPSPSPLRQNFRTDVDRIMLEEGVYVIILQLVWRRTFGVLDLGCAGVGVWLALAGVASRGTEDMGGERVWGDG